MCDVTALDGINVDLCFGIDHMPESDEKVKADYYGKFAGGPVANFSCIASSLGLKVAACCMVGADDNGKIVIDSFKKFGVDTRFVRVDESIKTPITVVLLNQITGERSIIIPKVVTSTSTKQLPKFLNHSKYLYCHPKREYITQKKILDIAGKKHVKVMIDLEPSFSYSGKELSLVLDHLEIASFNRRGFQLAFKEDFSPDLAKNIFMRHRQKVLIVTLGAEGAFCVSDQGSFLCQAFKVSPIDTTGAGDAFNAGFLTAYNEGLNHVDCLTWGCASSASVISTLGVRSKLKNRQQLKDFIHQLKGATV